TRFVDVMYAFPRLLFVILVMSMLGAGLTNIFIAIGLTGWVGIARQTRAQVLAIKEKEFVDGARALGAGFGRVLGRHVMPNALTPTPRISDSQMALLAARLAAVGVDRRDFLKVAAGLATLGAAGFNARPAAAAPNLAPGEKLARDQHVRLGGGGWWQNDPSSHDYNKDLYCSGVPILWAGLMKFNSDFQPVPYVATKVVSNADGSV